MTDKLNERERITEIEREAERLNELLDEVERECDWRIENAERSPMGHGSRGCAEAIMRILSRRTADSGTGEGKERGDG